MAFPLIFEPIQLSDIPSIQKLQPKQWGDITPAINWYLTLNYCYFIKATVNSEIIGCGAALVHENCVWLASIIVDEQHRNKGYGAAITQHLIEFAETKTNTILLIGTKLGVPVYKKLGFIEDEQYLFFKANTIALESNQAIVPFESWMEEDILKLDFETTGERRSHLILPKISSGFAYLKENHLLGFTIPSLGEGYTNAIDLKAGIALMNLRFETLRKACLPISNKLGIAHLIQQGFEIDTSLNGVKMYKGKPISWKPKQQFGRVGGNLG